MTKIIDVEALALLLWESGSNVWLEIRGLLDLTPPEGAIFSDLCQNGERTWKTKSYDWS